MRGSMPDRRSQLLLVPSPRGPRGRRADPYRVTSTVPAPCPLGVRSAGVDAPSRWRRLLCLPVRHGESGQRPHAPGPDEKDDTRAMTSRILVVDDDTALAEMIGIVLRTEGFDTVFCADGARAVDAWRSERPDLVLLDLMLPGVDGIEVCTRIRQESGIPIIMLTARTDTADVVKGLESGADDYIVKPFNPKELVARIRTRLRPASQPSNDTLRIGDLAVDVAAHEVRRGDEAIALTPLEFELLVALASKPQQVFSREMLLEQVWGYHYKADTRLVNVHVQRLRAKVELDPDNPRIVTTVRGVGYRAGAVV